jgi:signal peptidase I
MSERRRRAAESRAAERRTKEKGLLHYIGLGFSVGLLGLLLMLAGLVIGVPLVAGATPMTILTGSMEPTYPPGTLIIVKPIATDDIAIGDPITYQLESGKPEVVTHRVVSIANSNGQLTFITKGDNNPSPDVNPVLPVQIRGTVWYSVPLIGYVNTIISGENRGWIVPLLAVVLFAYAGFMFASGIAHNVRARREAREAALGAAHHVPVEHPQNQTHVEYQQNHPTALYAAHPNSSPTAHSSSRPMEHTP